jgi:hypothetical protein
VYYTSKALLVPHLRLILCTTGVSGILGRWLTHLNEQAVGRDVDDLNTQAPRLLQELWQGDKRLVGFPADVTVTVYHFGFSRTAHVLHAYAYRSVHAFRAERLAYGLGLKPVISLPDGAQWPLDIRAIMEAQRASQATLSPHERVYIGGEIQIHHLTMAGCNVSDFSVR